MTDSESVSPSQIERHLDRVCSNANAVGLPLAADILHEARDRWYGQLLVTVHDSLSERQDPETTLPAAAAVELLGGYVRLRSQLLISLSDVYDHSRALEPTEAILAGDYLYTTAFSSLASVSGTTSGDCVETLTTALDTITETLGHAYTPAGSTEYEAAMFFDGTAGSLGESAAVIGAILAGCDETNRHHIERLGGGLGTARLTTLLLDADLTGALVVPPTLGESVVRKHATRGREDADRALDALSEAVDVRGLRAFTEATVTGPDRRTSTTGDEALE